MAEGVSAQVFYQDDVAMVRFPDGTEMSLADANSYFYPTRSFNPKTGQDMMLPSRDMDVTPKPDNYFGDVAQKYGNEELAAAKYLAQNAGTVAAQSLPEELGVLRNVASYPADMVNAGLMGALGAGQKGMAYLGEMLAPEGYEERAARDLNALLDLPMAAGAQSRMAASIADPAKNYVMNILSQKGLLK
jgi:hypothetical protein